ncbi:MAG: FAD:protein FMN transferase [Blastocatellia bacterium]
MKLALILLAVFGASAINHYPLAINHCPLFDRVKESLPNRLMGNGQWLMANSPLKPIQLRYEDSRISMACAYSIVVYGESESKLSQAVSAAFDEVDRIDRLMSHYKPESPLSQLNRKAANEAVKVELELFDFIAECLRYSRESDGAFDVTVGPLLKAWGFFRGEGRMPTAAELAEARSKVGWRHVILNQQEKTIRFDRAGVELDLGGIAKGYAVDKAVEVLKQHGISRALVSACGSTIYGLGAPPGETAWEVKLRDPVSSQKTSMTVRLNNRALSVSGSYEKFFDLGGKRYSHIFDPRTGWPAQGVLSVAMLTDTGTAGDALDNVFYVLGVENSKRRFQKWPLTKAFFFLAADKRAPRKWKLVTLNDKQ